MGSCPLQVGIKHFEIVPSKFAEGLAKDGFGGAAGYAKETARCKAVDVATLDWPEGRPDLIIGADTVSLSEFCSEHAGPPLATLPDISS